MLLRETLACAARLWPEREALTCEGRRFTYAQATERVRPPPFVRSSPFGRLGYHPVPVDSG